MRACATAGGGVMFISDETEENAAPTATQSTVSYKDLAGEKPKSALEKLELLGKKIAKIKKAS